MMAHMDTNALSNGNDVLQYFVIGIFIVAFVVYKIFGRK